MSNGTSTKVVLVVGVLLLGANGALGQDWPQWRGPNRDNKVAGFTAPKTWPKELTKKWRVTVGKGESSPVLVGNKLYVFARQGTEEVTLCLDAATGNEIWKDKYTAVAVGGAASGHPGTRSTPAVAEGKICTLGVGGVVSCLDAESGKVVWRKDTKSWPQFYTSYSPIIVDGKCIVFVGTDKKGALHAYDLASGESKWEWTGAGAPYGSPVLLTVDGTKQLVTPAYGSVDGIDVTSGKMLWQVKMANDYGATMGTPIVSGQTVYYSTPAGKGKGGGGGTVAFKVEKKDGGFTTTELWKKPEAAHKYNTPLLRDGLLYGLAGPAGIGSQTTLYCMDAATGNMLWTDPTKRGECGNILDVGSVILCLTSDTYLLVFEPSNKGYKELAKYQVADKGGAVGPWSCPIVAGNRIFVKDKGESLTLWTIE
jgi:outer membrane protein assembly factor BamB